jgi:hypothetical protein
MATFFTQILGRKRTAYILKVQTLKEWSGISFYKDRRMPVTTPN